MKEIKNIIYGLYDPPELGGNLRYIGQSAQGLNRAYEHKKPGLLKAACHKVHWIKQLISQNKMYKVQILRDLGEFKDSKVRDFALNEAEIELIAHYKTLGVKLTNSTDGGEGTRGNVLSDESKKLISEKRKVWLENNELPKHLWETCYKRKEHKFINGIENKHCSDCDIFRPLSEYFKNKSKNDGLNGICKSCDIKRKREYKNKFLLNENEWNESYEKRTPKMAVSIKAKFDNDPEYRKKIAKGKCRAIIGISEINSNDIIEFESAIAAYASPGNFHNGRIGISIKTGKQYKGYYWKFKDKK